MNNMNCRPGYTQTSRGSHSRNMDERRRQEAKCSRNDTRERIEERQEHAELIEIPTGNRHQLLCFINEVSFAAYEAMLFLDTHPDDSEALAYFKKYNHLRNHGLKEYSKRFGPLTLSTADDCSSNCWEWMNQPWPWEGGDC